MPQRTVGEMIERDRLVSADPGTTVRAAAEVMAEGRCGSVLVTEHGRLLGIFTERDLLNRVAAAGRDLGRTRLSEVMTRARTRSGRTSRSSRRSARWTSSATATCRCSTGGR